MERFAEWFDLGRDAPDIYARYRDWDLQMLRSLVDPWPEGWPGPSVGALGEDAVFDGSHVPVVDSPASRSVSAPATPWGYSDASTQSVLTGGLATVPFTGSPG